MLLVDLIWYVNLKKRNGALVRVPDDKVPVLDEMFRNGLWHHETHSKPTQFKIRDIKLKKLDADYKLIVSISGTFDKENLQTVIKTIENWIGSILQRKGQTNIFVFYDDDR